MPHVLPTMHAPALRWARVPLASVLRCFHPQSPVKTAGVAGGWFSSLHHFLLPDSCWREECTSRAPTEKPNLGDNQKCLTVNAASGMEPGWLPCPHWPPSTGLSSQLSHFCQRRRGTHKAQCGLELWAQAVQAAEVAPVSIPLAAANSLLGNTSRPIAGCDGEGEPRGTVSPLGTGASHAPPLNNSQEFCIIQSISDDKTEVQRGPLSLHDDRGAETGHAGARA